MDGCLRARGLAVLARTGLAANVIAAIACLRERTDDCKQNGGSVNTILPAIMQQLKPLVAKGSPQIERDFDALMPAMMNVMNAHLDAFLDSGAQIYARHFTAEEMQQVTSFYRSTAGAKVSSEQPELVREGMALGQQFGQAIARDVQGRMVDELRKRGHPI